MKLIDRLQQDSYFLVFVSCLSALILVYGSELILNLTPCMLCIYQRIPYFILLFISGAALLIPNLRKYFLFIVIFLYLVEIVLAGYHVGVEHYWIEETSRCQVDSSMAILSVSKIASSCSEVRLRFMNLSMAEWNLLYAIALLYAFIRIEKKHG